MINRYRFWMIWGPWFRWVYTKIWIPSWSSVRFYLLCDCRGVVTFWCHRSHWSLSCNYLSTLAYSKWGSRSFCTLYSYRNSMLDIFADSNKYGSKSQCYPSDLSDASIYQSWWILAPCSPNRDWNSAQYFTFQSYAVTWYFEKIIFWYISAKTLWWSYKYIPWLEIFVFHIFFFILSPF